MGKNTFDIDGYKQLSLKDVNWNYPDNRQRNPLHGKVIERVGLCTGGSESEQMLLVLFKDKTFICCGMEEDKDNPDCYNLANKNIYNGDLYKDSIYRFSTYIDNNGKLQFHGKAQMLVDFGLWDFNEEDAKLVMEQHIKDQEEREWEQYKHLRLKFKDRIEAEEREQNNG